MAMSTTGGVVAWGDADTRSVHVLDWDRGSWQERPVVPISLDDENYSEDRFYSLALSAAGDRLLVGEPKAQVSAGRAHMFRWDVIDREWTRIRTWVGNRGSLNGWSVSLSFDGRTLAVAAVENDLATITPGMVRIYKLREIIGNSEEVWTQIGQTLIGARDEDRFGTSVALSGSGQILAVGSPANDGRSQDGREGKPNAGQVRIFRWDADAGLWEAYGQTLKGTSADQNVGQVVSLSDDGKIVAAAGTTGGLLIRRLDEEENWIPWNLSGVSAPKTLADAVLSGSGKVVALSDRTTGAVHAYQAVSS